MVVDAIFLLKFGKMGNNKFLEDVTRKMAQADRIHLHKQPPSTEVVVETTRSIYSMTIVESGLPLKVFFKGKPFPLVIPPMLYTLGGKSCVEDIKKLFANPLKLYFSGCLLTIDSNVIFRGVLARNMPMEINVNIPWIKEGNFILRSHPVQRATIFGNGFHYKMEWE